MAVFVPPKNAACSPAEYRIWAVLDPKMSWGVLQYLIRYMISFLGKEKERKGKQNLFIPGNMYQYVMWLISLSVEDDAEALQKAESFVPNIELQKAAGSAESITEKPAETSPSVVFENIQGCSPKCLRMLLENISGLAVDDDFTVEVIPEINAAVATFIKSIGKTE